MRYPGGKKVLKPWIRFGLPAKSVDTRRMTPGVSILFSISGNSYIGQRRVYSRLTLEVLHDVKKLVVYLGIARELHLDLI